VWVDTVDDFQREVTAAFARNALSFVAARVEPGIQPGLKGIDVQAVENKFLLARHIERTQGVQVLAAAYPQR
jgi:UDP-N-acetylglucosamine transferase subunit ALG13